MSQIATIGELGHRLTGVILQAFHKKPRTLEATLQRFAIKQERLALYFTATKGDRINPQIYQPFYMSMEEPLVREIHQSLSEGLWATFSGTYNPHLDMPKDELERARGNGILIRLEGGLEIRGRIYEVEFDVDRLRVPFSYLYGTRLVNIKRKS